MRALTPTPAGHWRAYASLLLRRRPGLAPDQLLPVIGRATGTVKIDAAWLARYRTCIGMVDEPAVLPPLALQLAAAPLHLEILADRHFPFRALGLLPVSQRIDQAAAVLPGSLLRLEAFTGRCRPVAAGWHVELVTEARREGRLVWRSITTALARDSRRPRVSMAGDGESAEPVASLSDWYRIDLIRASEDLGRRYAAIAGDVDPIHRRAWMARRFGFERPVVQGSWTLARALAAAAWPAHEAFSLQASFRRPVMLPATLAVWVRQSPSVQLLRATDADGRVEHLQARIEPAHARLN